jgi:hypothetical protein
MSKDSNNRKRAAARPMRNRTAKLYWLPMPKRDSDSVILQYRLALEAVRTGRAGKLEIQVLAHAVLLTGMLTELGYGKLDAALIREVEIDVVAMLEHGANTGEWRVPPQRLPCLMEIINEHDRQMREVHLAALVACNERLGEWIAASSSVVTTTP